MTGGSATGEGGAPPRRLSRPALRIRWAALGLGVAGPAGFLGTGHAEIHLVLCGLAVLTAVLAAAAPRSGAATVSLLLFAGQVTASADGRSQGTILAMAVTGSCVLWAQHLLWGLVTTVPEDCAVAPGAFRGLVRRALLLLAVAVLLEVVMLAAADLLHAGSAWRWLGAAAVAALCVVPLVVVARSGDRSA